MARQGYPSDKQDQFVVRFPDGMRDRIKAAADANSRSMNAEVVARLEKTFNEDDQTPRDNFAVGIGSASMFIDLLSLGATGPEKAILESARDILISNRLSKLIDMMQTAIKSDPSLIQKRLDENLARTEIPPKD
ncbi:Arc family DNA-binding protein [Paracoccus denitrificans]|uniref:Arc family DNA-binding protein n=1 Tax=Paracoccus denitrificans TaxID=266 RepID=UPI003364BD78